MRKSAIFYTDRYKTNEGCSRKEWMLALCHVMLEFYPREIGKIENRIAHFQKVKQNWENKL